MLFAALAPHGDGGRRERAAPAPPGPPWTSRALVLTLAHSPASEVIFAPADRTVRPITRPPSVVYSQGLTLSVCAISRSSSRLYPPLPAPSLRPLLFLPAATVIFGIEEAVKCAQRGGVGIVVYFRKEGRALGEVLKSVFLRFLAFPLPLTDPSSLQVPRLQRAQAWR